MLKPRPRPRATWWLRWIARIAVVVLVATTEAQAQRYLAHHYGETDGLPSPRISDIVQDHEGRMWFATRQNLASYDGVSWSTSTSEGQSEPEDLGRILVDELDRLWSVPRRPDKPLRLRADGAWQTVPKPPDLPQQVERWAAATTLRIGEEVLLLATVADHGTFLCDGHDWHRVRWPALLGNAEPTAFAVHDSELFVATSRGLFLVNTEFTEAQVIDGTLGERIVGLEFDPVRGDLWVFADPWLGRYRPAGLTRIVSDLELGTYETEDYVGPVVDHLGAVYVGAVHHLRRVDPEKGMETLGRREGLARNGATAVFVDREGNVWVGTDDGLSKLVSLRLATLDREHGLLESEVTSVLQSQAGTMVLGHPNGVTILAERPETFELDATHDPTIRLLDIAEDRAGNLWFAVTGKGLAQRSTSGEWSWIDLPPEHAKSINTVLADTAGRIWVAGRQHLHRKDPGGAFEVIREHLGNRTPPFYRKLHQGRDDRIFVATARRGLTLFEGDATTEFLSHESDQTNDVVAVLDATDGTTWVGTLGGLRQIRGHEIVPIEDAAPWMDRSVYFILEDAAGSLWCGTEDGVVHWDRSEPGTRTWRRLTVEDGIAGRETNRDGGWIDEHGDVWIGTESGVTIYRERYEVPERPSPTMRILNVDIDGRACSPELPIDLDAGDHVLTFQFRGTGFVDESRIEYRYRLVGFDPGWSLPESVPGHSVRYTNLSPGSYMFEVQARGHEQPWSPIVRTAALNLRRPLWQDAWFQLLAVLAFVAVSYGVLWAIARHRSMRDLEREVQARVEEIHKLEEEFERARKLDSLGVLAGGIAHDFNNLLTVLSGSFALLESERGLTAEQAAICRDGVAATNRAQALAQQLLTFSRGGAPLLRPGSIAEVVLESSRFLMRGSTVRCECELPQDLWLVEMDPDQISQVLGNLLLNAQQASNAGATIHVRGRNHVQQDEEGRDARFVVIEIEDEGQGIPPDRIDRIFDPYYSTTEGGSGLGLATSYSIVHRHNGKLEVDSEVGFGTTFRMLIPAAEAILATRPPQASIPASTPPLHVLVMDDEEDVRRVLERMLARLGHRTTGALDGREALTIYERESTTDHPIDVVFMDLTIRGGMGGQEAVCNLLAFDPDARAIVVSGYSNDPVMADFESYGFRARLAKPIRKADLEAALASAVNGDSMRPAST